MAEATFTLPRGLEIDGRVYRTGKVRALTMGDELEVQGDPRVRKNPAWALPIALCRAITEWEDLPIPVDLNKLLQLKRVDYVYLMNEVSKLTDDGINLTIKCPGCGLAHTLVVDDLLAAARPLS